MKIKLTSALFISLLLGFYCYAQNDSIKAVIKTDSLITSFPEATKARRDINPLSPTKAAFYSAILPGLGQAYNKRYWKIPVVYAALGTGIYFYIDNNNEYNRYRDAYKRRLAGFEDDEFQNLINDDGLLEAQRNFRRNRDLSLIITIALYALNIIDANVDAHLLQFNLDDDLSVKPHYSIESIDKQEQLGLTLNFKF